MRIATFVFCVALASAGARGQQPPGQQPQAQQSPITATTEDGRKILVYPDGTWKPVEQAQACPGITRTPPGGSKVLVKAPAGAFGVWIDEQKWTKSAENDPTKILFLHTGTDGYAMLIGEDRVQLSLESLKAAAIANAKKAASDLKVLFQEKRVLNGKQVLCMEMAGTVQGTAVVYYGYYYVGPEGALQVLCYTSPSLFIQLKTEFDEFLNDIQIGQ